MATHIHPDWNTTDNNLQKDTITDKIITTIKEIKLYLEMTDHTTLTSRIIMDITIRITISKIIIIINKIIIIKVIILDLLIISITS